MDPMRTFLLASFAGSVGLFLLGCPSKDDAAPPKECTNTQALTEAPVFGNSIAAAKTIALTFDDGPGARTSELSTYLKGQGIRAAFFVNNNAQQSPHIGVLAQLAADGHVIGNHTKSHLDLVSGGLTPQQIIAELENVDTLIAPYVPNNRFLFRAPFGSWDKSVYDALKTSNMNKYVGHIEWESGGYLQPPNNAADVACFQSDPDNEANELTTQQCGDLYIADIKNKGEKGIVLMHDADYGDANGNTVDMVKYIVPLLKADGYTFIGVDEVPDIAAVLPPLPPKDAGAEGGEGGTSSSGGASSSGGSSGGASSGTTSSGGSSGSNPCP